MLSAPHEVTYYPPSAESEALDALVYVPHGGKFERFMADNRERLEGVFWLEPELLEAICTMEADTFTPEIAHRIGQILETEGLRAAVANVLHPREILDLNRLRNRSINPTFDYLRHTEVATAFQHAYDAVANRMGLLMRQLKPTGKKMELHSMRPGDLDADLGLAPRITQISNGGRAPDEIQSYYDKRRRGLQAQNNVSQLRDHCLVIHHGNNRQEAMGNMVADPVLVEHTKRTFNGLGISCNESETYFLLNTIMREGGDVRYRSGILIDLVKTSLCREKLGEDFNLARLTPDQNQLDFYAELLASILLKSLGRRYRLPKNSSVSAQNDA